MTRPNSSYPADSTQRTAQLLDRADITDLVYRLGASLDEHRFDDLPALLTDEATATTPGGTARGRDATIAQATRNHAGYDRLHHVVTNVLVDLDGDRATVRANLVATFVREASQPELVVGGVYRFQVERTGQGWRIASIEFNPVWRTESS